YHSRRCRAVTQRPEATHGPGKWSRYPGAASPIQKSGTTESVDLAGLRRGIGRWLVALTPLGTLETPTRACGQDGYRAMRRVDYGPFAAVGSRCPTRCRRAPMSYKYFTCSTQLTTCEGTSPCYI